MELGRNDKHALSPPRKNQSFGYMLHLFLRACNPNAPPSSPVDNHHGHGQVAEGGGFRMKSNLIERVSLSYPVVKVRVKMS